jgi:hypothetical protein
LEYTTEIQQIDEVFYEPHDAEYWLRRWGMAWHLSNRLKAAFTGDVSVAGEDDGKRCKETMAKKLAR